MARNGWLIAAGILDVAGALLHLACIVGGPRWYAFFGAGRRMVHFAERGRLEPAFFAVAIAAVLAGWAAYAFSGAGVIGRLPLLRPALIAIAGVYLLRAAALPLMLAFPDGRSATFLVWSSAVVLVFGAVHAIGLASQWRALGQS